MLTLFQVVVENSKTQSVSIMVGNPKFSNTVDYKDLKYLKETVEILEKRVSDLEDENNYLKENSNKNKNEVFNEEFAIYDESRPLNNDILIK